MHKAYSPTWYCISERRERVYGGRVLLSASPLPDTIWVCSLNGKTEFSELKYILHLLENVTCWYDLIVLISLKKEGDKRRLFGYSINHFLSVLTMKSQSEISWFINQALQCQIYTSLCWILISLICSVEVSGQFHQVTMDQVIVCKSHVSVSYEPTADQLLTIQLFVLYSIFQLWVLVSQPTTFNWPEKSSQTTEHITHF